MTLPGAILPLSTVQLLHTLKDGSKHVDWLIAQDAEQEQPLISFRCVARLDDLMPNARAVLERIPDHRPEYLTYEGPISGDRGEVRRLSRGKILSWYRSGDRPERYPDGWIMAVEWERAPSKQQLLHVYQCDLTTWLVTCTGVSSTMRSQ